MLYLGLIPTTLAFATRVVSEAGSGGLIPQFLRPVEITQREPIRPTGGIGVAVYARGQVLVHDAGKTRVCDYAYSHGALPRGSPPRTAANFVTRAQV